jgi:SpoIID/LytB domain protein
MSQYGAMEMARDGYSAKSILAHYYSGTTYDAVTDNQTLLVNVLHAVPTVTAKAVSFGTGGGTVTVKVSSSTSPTMTATTGEVVTFTRDAAVGVVVSCDACSGATRMTGTYATITWDTSRVANQTGVGLTGVDLNGTTYRDAARAEVRQSTSSGLEVVNHVRLHDEYLDHLREVPWSWPLESLKAQAAAARGYALSRLAGGVRSVCQCHVYDTTSDQVYGGYPSSTDLPYWDAWKRAVRAAGSASTGYVVRYRGAIISAFYSSSTGGRTENNEDVWGGTALPYLRGVDDHWSLRASNPNRSWKLTATGTTLAGAFGLPDIARLDLRDRTANGGIHTATATSTTGSRATITGEQFRTRVGTKSISVRHLTSRLAGADRYAVAAAVARSLGSSATSVVVAAGDSTLVDASVSGPLAGALDAPMLLTTRTRLPSATVAELDRRGSTVKTAYVVGGTGVVAGSVVDQLRARGLSVVRVAGADRYGTSEAVARQVVARRTVGAVVVAGGAGLPDALGASGPATALDEPILLTPPDGLAAATRRALEATGATEARVVGGTAVVGDAVVTQLEGAGLTVTRLAGDDRFASSRAVADFYRPRVATSEVVLTSGADANLVDSLVAGTRGRLVVLTRPTSLVEDAAAALQGTPLLETVTAVGGTGALRSAALTAAARS